MNVKQKLNDTAIGFLGTLGFLLLVSLMVACSVSGAVEPIVDVHIQSERCRPNLDTGPTHNYVAVTDGVKELAEAIKKVQLPGGGLTLDVCTWEFEGQGNALPYTVDSVVEDDSIIYIVANSYYEPDTQEFCQLIHDEVSDILWQAGHISKEIGPCMG